MLEVILKAKQLNKKHIPKPIKRIIVTATAAY
jgi:hypothetical protein